MACSAALAPDAESEHRDTRMRAASLYVHFADRRLRTCGVQDSENKHWGAHAHDGAVLLYLDGVTRHAVDPRVANLLRHHRQLRLERRQLRDERVECRCTHGRPGEHLTRFRKHVEDVRGIFERSLVVLPPAEAQDVAAMRGGAAGRVDTVLRGCELRAHALRIDDVTTVPEGVPERNQRRVCRRVTPHEGRVHGYVGGRRKNIDSDADRTHSPVRQRR